MAKSKAKRRGGKRKGAGRPRLSKTGKTSNFSTRIAPETRSLLETESRLSRQSLSQTIERLLVFALEEKQNRRRPKPIRAINYLIAQLSEMITVALLREKKQDHPEFNWRSNPFMFEAFRVAVMELFDALRPEGEIIAPLPLPEHLSRMPRYDDPEHCGRNITQSLLRALQFFGANTPEEIRSSFESPHFNPDTLDQQEQMHYRLHDAVRDLGLDVYEDLDTLSAISMRALNYKRRRRSR